jgi:hypothetical protein
VSTAATELGTDPGDARIDAADARSATGPTPEGQAPEGNASGDADGTDGTNNADAPATADDTDDTDDSGGENG